MERGPVPALAAWPSDPCVNDVELVEGATVRSVLGPGEPSDMSGWPADDVDGKGCSIDSVTGTGCSAGKSASCSGCA